MASTSASTLTKVSRKIKVERVVRCNVKRNAFSTTSPLHHNSTAQSRATRCLYKPLSQPQISHRPFSTSQCLGKKGGKGGKASREPARDEGNDAPAADDPHDFSVLEADIKSATERLKTDLSKLSKGGRFNTESLENLRVQPDKKSEDRVKLSDLAQIIPKGRTVQVIVSEKEYVKPVSSSIQSSDLSLNPQPDPTGTNPLLLVLHIPPPTAESRQVASKEAVKAGDKASTAVREARAKQHKKHRAMQKSVRPDDLRKASQVMEKVVEQGNAEVKKMVENARKVLESV